MYETVLRNARLFGHSDLMDIGIKEGRIIDKAVKLPGPGQLDIDLAGKLVVPGFVDIHTHLEKTLTAGIVENNTGTLGEAIANFKEYFDGVPEEDFYRRAYQALKMAVSNGTTAVRSHITVDPRIGLTAARALLRLKEEMAHVITLQVVAFPTPDPDGISTKQLDLLRQAVEEGADVVGGCPTLDPDYRRITDLLFDLAGELGKPLDLHVDESDVPNVAALTYVAEKTIEKGMVGRVTAGHCCALSAVSKEEAEPVIAKIKEAGITVVTLPSCNLYLMGREDCGLVRRGITRVKELLAAGVPVAYSSDNVRDPFRPFGNADMLEEALLTAQVLQMGTDSDLELLMKMGTLYPAKAAGLQGYGLNEGNYADLVVLDAFSAPQAIIEQAEKLLVFKRGRLIVENSRKTSHHWEDQKS